MKKRFGRWNVWNIKEQMCQMCSWDVWGRPMRCCLGMEHVMILWEMEHVVILWEIKHVMIEGNGTYIVGSFEYGTHGAHRRDVWFGKNSQKKLLPTFACRYRSVCCFPIPFCLLGTYVFYDFPATLPCISIPFELIKMRPILMRFVLLVNLKNSPSRHSKPLGH